VVGVLNCLSVNSAFYFFLLISIIEISWKKIKENFEIRGHVQINGFKGQIAGVNIFYYSTAMAGDKLTKIEQKYEKNTEKKIKKYVKFN